METYSNYYKKVFSVIFYVTILLLLVSCGRNESKEEKHSTFEYAKMALQIYPAQTEISSSDAKFMNNHIIAGVGGNLNIMNLDRSVLAEFPDIEVNWIDSIDEDGLVIYGNSERQIGIAQIDFSKDTSSEKQECELIFNSVLFQKENLCIDPTIIKVKDWYYITFTEIIGTVNNPISFDDDDNSVNGEYILHMYRAKTDSDIKASDSWEEVSVIQDNHHNTEDIDILYKEDHFMVFFEYEDYDKGCSAIKVIESLDSEGREWGEPTELLPNDADHEMASIWEEGDNYILWYSCDKNSVGESYMKGQIFYAVFDKNWELISKDIEVAEDYNDIGGVRLYEVNRINDKITFLYAKDYLTNNELSVLQEK